MDWRYSGKRGQALVRTGVAVSALLVVLSFWRGAVPSFGPIAYAYDANAPQNGVLPLDIASAGKDLHVSATITLGALHPVLFSVVPDDCLEELSVNGATVPFQGPMCFDRGGTVWLYGLVHPGTNAVEMRIRDHGGRGGVRIGVSLADPLLILSSCLLLGICLFYAHTLVTLFGHRRVANAVVWIAAVALAARLPLVLSPGYLFDVRLFARWGKSAVEFGLAPSYLRQLDNNLLPNYPPLSLILFAGAGEAYKWLFGPMYDVGLPDCIAFLKLPAIIADVLTAVLLFFIVRRLRGGDSAAAVTVGTIYALQPGVLYESAVWGQVDSLFSLAALAALAAVLAKRWTLAGALAVLAILTKFQAVVILPTVVVVCWLERGAMKRAAIGALLAGGLVLVPFLSVPALKAIAGVYLNSVGFFPMLSASGYNAWVALFGLAQRERPDSGLLFGFITYRHMGLLLFGSCALALPLVCVKKFREGLRAPTKGTMIFVVPALTTYAFFLFNTEMHERYLFPLIPWDPLESTCRHASLSIL